ncbi:uridine kinase [Gottschalkia purinilytica]|uniref:Uridine kinase n=1 Tax=Gottschalkia purinilytica TaxID=1503 RepID=A0A0L0WCT9_GOTPU|nr:uridine kinase [Gottschalkia purinilytica]
MGGSGKTTLAKELIKEIKKSLYEPVVLHIDDFIYPKNIRYNKNYDDWYCYYYLQWRYRYLIDGVLQPIKNGDKKLEKKLEIYDKDKDNYKLLTFKYMNENTILIIEGIFLQRPELKDFFDYIIYIDIPKKTRMKRVLDRDKYIGNESDIIHKYKNRYFPAEDRYEIECFPKQNADLVIK